MSFGQTGCVWIMFTYGAFALSNPPPPIQEGVVPVVLPSRQGTRHAQLYLLLCPPNVVLASFESILARVALWSSPLPSAIPVISSSPLNPCTS